jgi:hypothetical protein
VTADKPGNLANLQAAGAARTAATAARAEAALDQMTRNRDPVTFRGLAAAAGVSLDFLYRHAALRDRVTQLRARQQSEPPAARAAPPSPAQPSSVIAALTAQLADAKRRYREENTELRRALEAAHGENLQLRRRIATIRQNPVPPLQATRPARHRPVDRLQAPAPAGGHSAFTQTPPHSPASTTHRLESDPAVLAQLLSRTRP